MIPVDVGDHALHINFTVKSEIIRIKDWNLSSRFTRHSDAACDLFLKHTNYLALSPGFKVKFLMTFLIVGTPQV